MNCVDNTETAKYKNIRKELLKKKTPDITQWN